MAAMTRLHDDRHSHVQTDVGRAGQGSRPTTTSSEEP